MGSFDLRYPVQRQVNRTVSGEVIAMLAEAFKGSLPGMLQLPARAIVVMDKAEHTRKGVLNVLILFLCVQNVLGLFFRQKPFGNPFSDGLRISDLCQCVLANLLY